MNEAKDSRFVTRKWNIVNDQSNENYGVENDIICNKEALKSSICHYSDTYISVRRIITIVGQSNTSSI